RPTHEVAGLLDPAGAGPNRRQVFGLTGEVGPEGSSLEPDGLLVVASRITPVLCDDGRSRTPLRGSPGFPPGSLLSPGPHVWRTREPGPSALETLHLVPDRYSNPQMACRSVRCRIRTCR